MNLKPTAQTPLARPRRESLNGLPVGRGVDPAGLATCPGRKTLNHRTDPFADPFAFRPRITVPPDASIGLSADLISEIAEKIVRRFHPVRIVLFGSRARGNARPDSDIDLFVEMESRKSRHEREVEVLDLFGVRPWSMDLIVYTPNEVRKNRGMIGFVMDEIEKEGFTLYEQAESKR